MPDLNNSKSHRVLIIGGGFGGLYAARALRNAPVDITLIDRRNFHLFQPLLYQVATGALSPGDIAAPLRDILHRQRNIKVFMTEAVDFDPARRMVLTRDQSLEYDTLIVSPGSVTSYFGHDEWRDTAVGLKLIEEAIEIRQRVFRAFEEAEKLGTAEERQPWLTFVVIGAGPTGVELAGALGEIAHDTHRGSFRRIDPAEIRILLVDGLERVLNTFPPDLSSKAEKALGQLGAKFLPKHLVVHVDARAVTVQRQGDPPREIPTHTAIWAAGVRAHPLIQALAQRTGTTATRGGQIPVQPDCSVPGHPEIFVIGDAASFAHPEGAKPLPGVAPVAIQQGQYVAKVIAGRLRQQTVPAFTYRNKGSLATIGRNLGVADFGRLRFDGVVAWLLWMFVHVLYLAGFRNRALVLLQWAFQYVTYNRGARLITGDEAQAADHAPQRTAEPAISQR